jgi:hypothetical protein
MEVKARGTRFPRAFIFAAKLLYITGMVPNQPFS